MHVIRSVYRVSGPEQCARCGSHDTNVKPDLIRPNGKHILCLNRSLSPI